MPSKPCVLFEGQHWRLLRLGRETVRIAPLGGKVLLQCSFRVSRADVKFEPIDSPPAGRRYEGWPGDKE